MSSENNNNSSKKGYVLPSSTAEIVAVFVGLGLVYGMITLVGNGQREAEKQPVVAHQVAPAPHASGKTVAEAGPEASASAFKGAYLGDYARGELDAFVAHAAPQTLPEFSFVDESGKSVSLNDFRGKVVVLNLWATWCAPCRHEMPALDAVKKAFEGRPVEILTISIDRGGLGKPRRFFNEIGVKNLTLYGDNTGRLAPLLRAIGMPTTLLIDPEGREIGRLIGPAEWNSPDAKALIEAALNGKRGVGAGKS